MARRHRRITIAPGIVRDGDRLIATKRAGSARDGDQVRATKTYPLGTPIPTMQAWRLERESKFLIERPRVDRGTLAADVDTFLATLPLGRYRDDSAQILRHWATSPLGLMSRAAVTRIDVISQIATWGDDGAAVNTCNRRLSRLRKLYDTLDGLDAPNPTDKIKFQGEPEREPRDIPTRIVRLILAAMPAIGKRDAKRASATRLRLGVMAWTGIPPATIARIRPRDLDLARARVYLRPRRKGKGADGAWVALLPDAVAAFRAFVAAGLVGLRWSNSSAGKTWRVAIKRATATAAALAEQTGDESWRTEIASLPFRCKPYDLRHSFGSEIYRVTGDIRAVAELLQHADMETTKRYTKGAVSERVTAAIAAAADVYAAVPTPPAPTPARALRLVTRGA